MLSDAETDADHKRFVIHWFVFFQKRVPQYPTMFSELRHHPRFHVRLDVTDPVPKFISRQWRGYGEQAREALIRHTTLVVISCMYFLNIATI